MLHLKHSYAAYPPDVIHHLRLLGQSLLVYPSADAVIILDASSLNLVRVLAFSEAFLSTVRATARITCVAVDSSMKLIVAAMNARLVAWSLSGVQEDTWRIHSILSLPDNHVITALDCQSGLLAVGTTAGLSVYTLILENDLPTWSPKWTVPAAPPSLIRFSPSLMYIATLPKHTQAIRLYSTASGRQTQIIPHPRPISKIFWRHSQASSRDDLILYTVTNDSIIRIFLPVIDSPHCLQLHMSLDLSSALPFSFASNYSEPNSSAVFWLDRVVVGKVLDHILGQPQGLVDSQSRRIKEVRDEGWDLFLRILPGGSVVVTAVANIDRRPPTLLRQFTLQQLPSSILPDLPSHLYVIPNEDLYTISLVTVSPLSVFNISPLAFFDGQSDGLRLSARVLERVSAEENEILGLVRTPEGNGVGVIRVGGCGEAWRVAEHGSRLIRSISWDSADLIVILQGGRTFATYSGTSNLLTLHSTPPQSLSLPIITTLFSMPSQDGRESIIGITVDFSIIHLYTTYAPSPSLIFHSQSDLPIPSPPKVILPVDPMAWSLDRSWIQHDVLLSISTAGELAFWVPEESAGSRWRCTGKVRTGRTNIRRASCSSAKKTVLGKIVEPHAADELCPIVVPGHEGDELTIWDSQESEFATGLEFCREYSESIRDLDWTSTPDMQSILAVGFLHRVELLCQQRLTYFDEGPGWAVCATIEIGNFIPYQINDSIWLSNGSLLIAAGHQILLYGSPSSYAKEKNLPPETLFEYVARHNGPLEDYHPQIVLQCLLWDKVELVKDIIVNLARIITGRSSNGSITEWKSLPVEQFLRKDASTNNPSLQRRRYSLLFDGPNRSEEPDEGRFSRPLVTRLISALEAVPLPHLTPNEQAHLLTLIQTTLEIDEQRRALDSNGLRYLISMRSFYILNHRASAPSSPESKGALPRKTGRRERIRYRDMIWAFHSESQGLLLNASTTACNGRMVWSDARALGLPIWLTSLEAMKAQMEIIARNEYMADDNRDPTVCTLYYFSLGKVKLVHGLWRQASWHKEQAVMLKFLANDFTQARWRTAALKNAFALLSKQRFEYAAAFFLLGNSLRDAVNVCVKQLADFQLAVALARVAEQSNEGPVLLEILRGTVLPIAFKHGNRWLSSWAFWLLHRRDLAVRVLLTPLQDLAAALDIRVVEIGEPHYDDPSLALLFSQLRSKTLQTAKGTSEISGQSEFNFVLQMARVFCRMGCHVLALDLVKSWTFDRPSMITQKISDVEYDGNKSRPPSPATLRRSMFHRDRRSSILIDMQVSSLPPTRTTSPERPSERISTVTEGELMQNDGGFYSRKVELGNLMKSAKQDIKVPEFDLNLF